MSKQTKLPAMVLQELTVKRNFAPPEYNITRQVSGSHQNFFEYTVTVSGIQATGSGASKQISKHKAAYNALMQLKDLKIYDPEEIPVEEFDASINKNCDIDLGPLTYISTLSDLCFENKIPLPVFTEISDVGPAHSRQFTYECTVASIKTQATGATKKKAKHMAAKEMLEKIKDMIPDLRDQSVATQKALTDSDQAVIDKIPNIDFYNSIVPNMTVPVAEYSNTLSRMIEEKELKIDEFREILAVATEENLEKFVKKLELRFKCSHTQEDPSIVTVALNTETPCTSCALGTSYEDAKIKALNLLFEIIKNFLDL